MNTKEYNGGQKVKCYLDSEEITITPKEAKGQIADQSPQT